MDKLMNGSEIVASIAGASSYWQMGAGGVMRWAATLPFSATQDNVGRIEWVGTAWDGSSQVSLGGAHEGEIIGGEVVTELLGHLSREIPLLGIAGIEVPGPEDVRTCFIGSSDKLALVIDVNFGDFDLPLYVDHCRRWAADKLTSREIANGMLGILKHADKVRDRILRRERTMRRALEETALRIGDGVAPLWLRMAPFPHYENPKYVTRSCYVMLLVVLNDELIWAPTGYERIWTVKEIREYYRWHHRDQKARADAIRKLHAARSEGWISEVALAIINEKGLDPRDVFRQAVAEAKADRRGAVRFERNGNRETLYVRDGVLSASLVFAGGAYTRNTLTLSGDYPATLALGAKGRKLADFVDHPAFVATGLVATKGVSEQGALEIFHSPRNVSVEEAVRRSSPHALAA